MRTSDPGIIPPPKTRFISTEPALNLGKSSVAISFMGLGELFVLFVLRLKPRLLEGVTSSNSSTKVFH